MSDGEPLKIRGFEVANLAEFVRSRVGEGWEDIFQDAGVSAKPRPTEWYPVEALSDIFSALGSDTKLYREFGRFTARKVGSGLRILRFVSNLPLYLVKNANVVWRYYFSRGKLEILESGDDFALVAFQDCNIPEPWVEEVAGWIESALDMGGSRNARAEVLSAKPDEAIIRASW